MNPPKNRRNTITQYSIQEKHIIGEAVEQIRNYDLMSAVMICLGDEDDKNYGGLLKFLEVLLSEEKSPETKKEILETEFDVPMTQTPWLKLHILRTSLSSVCVIGTSNSVSNISFFVSGLFSSESSTSKNFSSPP